MLWWIKNNRLLWISEFGPQMTSKYACSSQQSTGRRRGFIGLNPEGTTTPDQDPSPSTVLYEQWVVVVGAAYELENLKYN